MTTDSCLQRSSSKWASKVASVREQLDKITADLASIDPRAKTAGMTVYLMEELGDARLRCEELVRYVAEATKLVEKSTHRDHFFEVAGHLIQGIPESLFKLQKAIQAVSLAASRMDYEELKQELRPEKVEELEQVLKDIRIRHVQRRSDPIRPWEQNMIDDLWKSPEAQSAKTAAEPWKATELKEMQDLLKARGYDPKDAKKLQDDGMGPYELEHRLKTTKPGEMGSLEFTHNLKKKKASDEEKESRFEEGKPADPTENMSPEDAKRWKEEHEKNKDNFKAAATTAPKLAAKLEKLANDLYDFRVGVRGAADEVQDLLEDSSGDILSGAYGNARVKDVRNELRAADNAMGEAARGAEYLALILKGRRTLQASKEAFDPGLYSRIKPGCGVTIVTPHGHQVTGMAIAPGPAGWILNVKGRPGIAHPENVVKVAGNDEKESRFEEGKPADPTENMAPEDAKKWKEEHAKNKDNFKSAELDWKAPEALHVAAKVEWTQKGGKWVARVSYAGGAKHEWTISESGSGFSATVKTPKGAFKRKKSFNSLEQAQRFADRFIDRANGHEMLEDSLDKDFQEV